MLSRLALRNAQLLPTMARATPALMSSSSSSSDSLYRRPVRLDKPGAVRMGFIPEEWFTFFYQKTGVSGPYMFGISLSTFLISKEIYVLEHEFYTGVSFLIIWIILVKKLGPQLAAYLDKEIDKVESEWKQGREMQVQSLQEEIEHEKKEQWRTEAQQMITDAKKENIKMQLEATYRERMLNVYTEVKKRLDYQVQIQQIERRIAQKHMVQWIINSVLKAITPEQEKATLQQCIKDLESLSATAKV